MYTNNYWGQVYHAFGIYMYLFCRHVMLFCEGDQPPLHEAVEYGDTSAVRRQLRQNASLVNEKWDTETALHVACRKGYHDIVEVLLKYGADIGVQTDCRYETSLYLAAKFGHFKVVQLITSIEDFDINDSCGLSALYGAVRYGWTNIVKYLMTKNIDMNTSLSSGHTPLTLCAKYGHSETIDLILKSGECGPNDEDGRGNSPLFLAIRNQQRRVVHTLLKRGATVNLYNTAAEMYPIHMAVNNDHLECVELLISARCQLNLRDGNGQTPLYIASELGLLRQIRLLISSGANPNIFTDDMLNTCLLAGLEAPLQAIYLCGSDPLNISRLIIQAGCDIDHENRLGYTCLQVALDKQMCDVALMLLAADCSINSRTWFTMENDCFLISRDNDCSELYEIFKERLKNALPLRNLCRIQIRRLLTYSWPYRKNVRQLPLPTLIKHFLLFQDIG